MTEENIRRHDKNESTIVDNGIQYSEENHNGEDSYQKRRNLCNKTKMIVIGSSLTAFLLGTFSGCTANEMMDHHKIIKRHIMDAHQRNQSPKRFPNQQDRQWNEKRLPGTGKDKEEMQDKNDQFLIPKNKNHEKVEKIPQQQYNKEDIPIPIPNFSDDPKAPKYGN